MKRVTHLISVRYVAPNFDDKVTEEVDSIVANATFATDSFAPFEGLCRLDVIIEDLVYEEPDLYDVIEDSITSD